MKCGDLVKLSAYGRKRKRAEWIDHDDIGLITRVVEYSQPWADDYIVQWMRSSWTHPRRSWSYERSNTRKDLMYVK